MKLERTRVVATALKLLNKVGIDGLTTRSLAKELGVQSPALYWHFQNKQALLDALATAMLVEGHTCRVPKPNQHWHEFLAENARSFRSALLAYRDGARLHAGTRPDPGQLPGIESQVEHLCHAGFPAGDALRAGILIGRYVVGCVLEEQTETEVDELASFEASSAAYPHLAAGFEALRGAKPDADFEFGLQSIIAGLKALLAKHRSDRPPSSKLKQG
ncbi:MAG: TetR/AcrR family transcriptional regulator C-terminal domain-containing protein [Planctomycetes bacterium]|nr:TetR/AcrR family transcriptional regulator C-terminal domain-containing protein [Planctomycetota bacterium]